MADATSGAACMAEHSDKIHIRGLSARCIVGIFPREREVRQEVLIDLVLEADLAAACHSDDIADTVDYKELKNRVLHLVEGSQFFLIERLAEAVAAACLETPRVQRATVTLDKPGALRFARSVAVEITRQRPAAE